MRKTTSCGRIKKMLFVIAVSTISYPIQAQITNGDIYLSCLAAEKDDEGEWIASRYLAVKDGAISSARDSYEWSAKKGISIGPGMTLKWDIGYDWRPQGKAPNFVPEDKAVVSLHFWYDAQYLDRPVENPERTWIHFYRSANREDEFSVDATSLTGLMLWTKFNNGNLSTKAVIPLDHLLAFGTGFDTLVWNIRTGPNHFGGTHALAKGVIPIAAMRGKVSKLPKLRRMLDRKATNFRTECHVPATSPPS